MEIQLILKILHDVSIPYFHNSQCARALVVAIIHFGGAGYTETVLGLLEGTPETLRHQEGGEFTNIPWYRA